MTSLRRSQKVGGGFKTLMPQLQMIKLSVAFGNHEAHEVPPTVIAQFKPCDPMKLKSEGISFVNVARSFRSAASRNMVQNEALCEETDYLILIPQA